MKSRLRAAIALVGLVVLTYVPIWHAGFIWDDDNYIEQNLLLRTPHGLWRIWFEKPRTIQYYPLTLTSFWIEHHFYGNRPLGYHLDNLLIHAGSCVMLWLLLRRLGVPGAWLAAAVWGIHPVNVESVAWATERKNVLSGFFYLAAAMVWLRGFSWCEGSDAERGVVKELGSVFQGGDSSRSTAQNDGFGGGTNAPGFGQWRYWGTLGLFVCAILSKTTAASWPAAMLLVVWWKRGKIAWRDVALTTPFFVLGIVAGQWTAYLERTQIGASGAAFAIGGSQRLLIACRAVWFYVGKVIWPRPLVFIYPRWTLPTPGVAWVLPASLIIVAVLLLLLRNRIGRGALVVMLLFAGTLFPALGFVNVYPMKFSFVADHFQYLASAFLIAGIVALLVRYGRRGGTIVAVVWLAILGALCWERIGDYRNIVTLWRDTVEKNPTSPMVQESYAAALRRQADALAAARRGAEAANRYAEAQEHNLQAIELEPGAYGPYVAIAAIHATQKDFDDAERFYRLAVKIAPDEGETHFQLGQYLDRTGRADEALAEYRAAVKKTATHEPAWDRMGMLLAKTGHVEDGIAALRTATEVSPDAVLAHRDLAEVLEGQGKFAEAAEQWRAGLDVFPDDMRAMDRLGIALARAGRLGEAEAVLRRAIQLHPEVAMLQSDLAVVEKLRQRSVAP